MVQLKEFHCFFVGSGFDVSIPNGSIKSFTCNSFISEILEFQFLMVQLKVKSSNIPKISLSEFQFLMVQLKDLIPVFIRIFLFKFQFLMVQLKEILFERVNFLVARFQFLMVQLKAAWNRKVDDDVLGFNS